MAITSPVTMPASMVPKSVKFFQNPVVGVHRSPQSGVMQVQAHPGQWWSVQAEYAPKKRATAADWVGFVTSLNGSEHTFNFPMNWVSAPRGGTPGTPTVFSHSQTGQDLISNGWTATQSNVLKRGDYIQIGTSLYMNLLDTDSNSNGMATLTLWPDLRSNYAANTTIATSNCNLLCRMDGGGQWDVDTALFYGVRISATEAI